jgi:hypothetical protein
MAVYFPATNASINSSNAEHAAERMRDASNLAIPMDHSG